MLLGKKGLIKTKPTNYTSKNKALMADISTINSSKFKVQKTLIQLFNGQFLLESKVCIHNLELEICMKCCISKINEVFK